MIKEIKIENIIVISSFELDLSSNLNILTGETGSGKSVLFHSLLFILGERLDFSSLMDSKKKGFVEVLFDISNNEKIRKKMLDVGISIKGDLLFIRREITPDKKSRNLVNNNLIPSYFLKNIGKYLLDYLGQHSNQALLRVKNHKYFLDEFSNLKYKIRDFREKRSSLKKYLEKKSVLTEKIKAFKIEEKERMEIIKRIQMLNIKENEDKEIQEKINRISKIDNIKKLIRDSYKKLYEEENSVLNQVEFVNTNVNQLLKYDDYFQKIYNDLKEATFLLQNVHEELRGKKFSYEDFSNSLDDLNQRLYEINQLKRLYGPEISDIYIYLRIQKEKAKFLDKEIENLKILNKKMDSLYEEIKDLSFEISLIRKEKSSILENLIQKELMILGMQDTEFKIKIDYSESNDEDFLRIDNHGKYISILEDGIDQVEFLFRSNVKKDFEPLVKIASGGELSRVILAIKSILIEIDNVNTLLLDEVDTGVGGEIAFRIGEKIKLISRKTQVICITHLAQIAVKADKHFLVEKRPGSDLTKIYELSKSARIKEIARMLSGDTLTKNSIEHAREMIEKS